MELSIIIPHIEALVFASEKPLTVLELVDHVNNALGFIEDRASLDQVESAVEGIKEKYNSEFYPFELKESGGGLQFLTKPVYHKTVATLSGDKFLKRLSTAALETLSIIAYKQPITKGEIESIRGVNCDYAVQKLLEKELVVITGRKENAPGQPLIYATSKSFMDYFGLNSADELPKLSDIIPQDIVASTTVHAAHPVDEDVMEDEGRMVVDEEGNIEALPEHPAKEDESDARIFIHVSAIVEPENEAENLSEKEAPGNTANQAAPEQENAGEETGSNELDAEAEDLAEAVEIPYDDLAYDENAPAEQEEQNEKDELNQSAKDHAEHSTEQEPKREPGSEGRDQEAV